MAYPLYRKRFDKVREYIFPWKSEKDFIRIMGRFWLWRHGFAHQYDIGPYRADFASEKLGIVLEVEGTTKVPKDIVLLQEYGERRQARENFLLRKGWNILYIPTYCIWHHPNRLRKLVRDWVRQPTARITTVKM